MNDICYNYISAGGILGGVYHLLPHTDNFTGDQVISMKICSIDNCNLKLYAKNYCQKHYNKNRKYGDPLMSLLHHMSGSSEYIAWRHMKNRCSNPNDKWYHRYGGRGIKVYRCWEKSFIKFYNDMGKKPFPKAQIDRINNDGNYEPSNCRWATPKQNSRNTVRTKLSIEIAREIREFSKQYKELRYYQIAKIFRINQQHIRHIILNMVWEEDKEIT